MRGEWRALAGALIVGLAVGCASSGNMNDAQEARRTAEDANHKAEMAVADAAAARAPRKRRRRMRGRRTRRPTASFSVRSTNNAAAGSEDRANEALPARRTSCSC